MGRRKHIAQGHQNPKNNMAESSLDACFFVYLFGLVLVWFWFGFAFFPHFCTLLRLDAREANNLEMLTDKSIKSPNKILFLQLQKKEKSRLARQKTYKKIISLLQQNTRGKNYGFYSSHQTVTSHHPSPPGVVSQKAKQRITIFIPTRQLRGSSFPQCLWRPHESSNKTLLSLPARKLSVESSGELEFPTLPSSNEEALSTQMSIEADQKTWTSWQ